MFRVCEKCHKLSLAGSFYKDGKTCSACYGAESAARKAAERKAKKELKAMVADLKGKLEAEPEVTEPIKDDRHGK